MATHSRPRPRPLIGYVTRSGQVPHGHVSPHFGSPESYAHAIADNGGAPVMIPALTDEDVLDRAYEALDGLLLIGGPDVDPARYGQERHARTDAGDLPMEHGEFYLARRALDEGMPILGICRGMQSLNVLSGGTLHQHITEVFAEMALHPVGGVARDHLAHTVCVEAGSLLHQAVGSDEIHVNSLHHQGVSSLAPGFVASAVAPDGLVEAMERPDRPFVVAVQWHPEELYRADERWAHLFRAFVAAATLYHTERPAS